MKRSIHQHLAKLATLDLLVEVGSFRAASARAHVTQSALSQTVSALEGVFGCALLVRDGGSVRPTAACAALLERLQPVFRTLETVAVDLHLPKTELPALTSLDLGSFESLAIHVLPALTLRLRRTYPKLHLSIKVGRSGELVRLVRKGDLCMAIITELDTMDGLSTLLLAEDRLGVYVAADHPLAGGGRAALSELWLGSLAAAKDGHARYFARYLRANGLPKPAVTSDSFEALRAMAARGAIAAVLPTRVAARPHGGALSELDLGTPAAAGSHKILLASPKNCDRAESEYMATELRLLFRELI